MTRYGTAYVCGSVPRFCALPVNGIDKSILQIDPGGANASPQNNPKRQ